MSCRTYESSFFCPFHMVFFKSVFIICFFFLFVISTIFHIQLDIMFFTVCIIFITSVSCISRCFLRITSICFMIFFHKWYICIYIITVTADINISNYSIAHAYLDIISRFKYICMIIIIIFHMHKGCIRICLRKTVPFSQNVHMNCIFKHLHRVFF